MITHEIRIRHFFLSYSDLDRIIEIERASFTIDAFSEAAFKKWYYKCPDLFIVAEISGVVVGYMITCVLPEKGDIVSVAIDPSYRREGVGKTLVDFTLNYLKTSSVKTVELEVRTTNIVGICFWESLGFFPIGTIAHFYRDGAEALRMRKILGVEECRQEVHDDG